MTPAARIQAAIELLNLIAGVDRPADQVAAEYWRSHRYIGAKDRRGVSDLVYGVIRRRAALGWWLERAGAGKFEPGRSQVIAALILLEGWSAERIDRAFDGMRHHPKPMAPAERALAGALAGHTIDHPGQPDWVVFEVPEWLLPKLAAAFGPRLARELAALQAEAPLDLRVNALKATRRQALEALKAERHVAEPTPLSPVGLRLSARAAIAATRAYRNGLIEVQDEGSQLIALLTDARPGQRVCDFCAGAGGKTLALAAAMGNKGQVVALDVRRGRMARAALRLRRAGIHNVTRRLIASHRDPWVKRHRESFDRVLVDAPCTGCGTWRRNPDAKWRIGPEDAAELTALQAEILASASRLVKKGGRLVYATCSLLPEENDEQVSRFLADHSEFRLTPVTEVWTAVIGRACPASGATLTLTPAVHATDGFFIAILERG